MARVPYVSAADLPEEKRHLLTSFSPDVPEEYAHLLSTEERNVYRAFAHTPEALERFRAFGSAVGAETGLDSRERELLVLTVARALESAYEWHQHVRIGLSAGLSREEILAIADGRYDRFDPDERALVEYAAAVATGHVDDATFAAFADGAAPSRIVGVGLLVGVYLVIARQMDALCVDTEEPFVGWHLEALDA